MRVIKVAPAGTDIQVPVNCELLKLRVAKDCGRPVVEVSGEKVEGTWHLARRHVTLFSS